MQVSANSILQLVASRHTRRFFLISKSGVTAANLHRADLHKFGGDARAGPVETLTRRSRVHGASLAEVAACVEAPQYAFSITANV